MAVGIFSLPGNRVLAGASDCIDQRHDFPAGNIEDVHFNSSGGGQVNVCRMFVTMKEPKDRPRAPGKRRPVSQQEFMQVARKALSAIPGMRRAAIQDLSQSFGGTGRGYPIELSLRGPDWEKLGDYAEVIRTKLLETGQAVDVDTSYLVGVATACCFARRASSIR